MGNNAASSNFKSLQEKFKQNPLLGSPTERNLVLSSKDYTEYLTRYDTLVAERIGTQFHVMTTTEKEILEEKIRTAESTIGILEAKIRTSESTIELLQKSNKVLRSTLTDLQERVARIEGKSAAK
eukprot:TRINITY_DN5452_c0_g1_i4.p1 TRINITY_DN5452_c0_g1~~TRINITY_DN5452_c0_g1_i4.p1  ORF type:complete len:125 (-),score=6.06 TRINITY_DN5452_c0_g1_i4:60-434(-)